MTGAIPHVMNKLRLFLIAALLLGLGLNAAAQGRVGVYAIAFYNLENLFDAEDDPANPQFIKTKRGMGYYFGE